MNLLRIGLTALSMGLVSVAMAQSVEPGIHGGLNIPMGDLGDALDHRLGVTLGGHAGIYYGGGHELRPRLDFTFYNGGYTPVGSGFSKNKVDLWNLGCDYLYYTEMRPVDPYLTMGLGYGWWTVSPSGGSDQTNSGLTMAAGAGYRFNRMFSLEGRFTTGQFRDSSGSAHALQAVASMRF
jgi:opacity protein-like surface antigen